MTSEAILGRCSFDFDEEGTNLEVNFESVRRGKFAGEHRLSALVKEDEDLQWRNKTRNSQAENIAHVRDVCKENLMWTLFDGSFANVPEQNLCMFSLLTLMKRSVRLWMIFVWLPVVCFLLN